MMKAQFSIQADEQANMLARILGSEAADDVLRSNVRVESQVGKLTISIEAEDVVALRAALNSYMRWTKLAMDTRDVIGGIE